MSVNQMEALQFVFLGVCLTVSLYVFLRISVALYDKFKLELEYLNHPRAVPYNETALCEGLHSWQTSTLVFREIPTAKYQVCTECGCIMGRDDYMVSKEVLALMKETIQKMVEKSKFVQELRERIKASATAKANLFIEQNFSQELNDVHLAEKLKSLASFSMSALLESSEKVASEVSGQEELEERYENWPKITGQSGRA